MMRCFSFLLFASAFGLAACGDKPDPTPAVPTPPAPPVVADTPLGPEPPETDIPADSVVTPEILPESPADVPASSTPPSVRPSPVAETPAPSPPSSPRVEPPAAPAPPPTGTRTNRAPVEAFWTSFQAALRARDPAAIDDYLHTTVRVSGQDYDRDGPQVKEVVRQFAENPDLTEAYLDTSADELVVTGDRATFSSVARYTLAGEPYEVTVSGVLREVRPGTWRIVELASEPR